MITIFGIQFGKPFHSTAKIEEQRKQLDQDYKRYTSIKESDAYARYVKLSEIITSGKFEKEVESYKNFKYKNSATYKSLERYNRLKGSNSVKAYLKPAHDKIDVDRLSIIEASESYKRYFFLSKLVASNDFKIKAKAKNFKETEDFAVLEEYNALKTHTDVIYYNKFGLTKEYKNYLVAKESSEVREYISLKAEIESEEFIKLNAEQSDKHRYEKSEVFSQLKEFSTLKKSNDIIWVDKIDPKKMFASILEWKITFADDFDNVKLDKSKWLTSYYWGQAMLNDSYVTSDDKQIFKEKNVALKDGALRLTTLAETSEGKVWDSSKGFYSSKFDFTSGIVNNGHYFRQAYGKIEAKVRFSSVKGITSAFWLCAESSLPHINIFKTTGKNGNLLEVGKFIKKSGNSIANTKTLTFKNLGNEYHIYSIEWNKDKIVWKINDVVVDEQTDNIPTEGVYLNFSSHIKEQVDKSVLPASMEIDWVRCYSHQA